jgi:potassium channel subfamily K
MNGNGIRYLSSFALTALCSTATGPLRLPPDACWSYSQAFYYGTIAAALYFLIATLMVYTVLGAHLGHYSREFQLTVSQRTLMLQTISFLIYLLLGARIFSTLEDWSFLDALYWADFTLLTVGIGDYAPVTTAGRALLFPYAIGGIIILGLVIGSIRSLVLDRGKVKIGARMLERARERKLDDVEEKESSIMIPRKKNTGRGKVNHTDSWLDVGERERRLKEFEMMREIQKKAESRRRWTSLAISGGTWFVLWFAGAAIFMVCPPPQSSHFRPLTPFPFLRQKANPHHHRPPKTPRTGHISRVSTSPTPLS